MSAATILFTDIVGFSKKPSAEQKRLVESLTSEVIQELQVLLAPSGDTPPGIIALPTGDGLALGFLHNSNQSWDCSTIFSLILRIHKWADARSKNSNVVSLRIGIHVGAVEFVTDINGNANICGDTINLAQRVMDAANPRQTLFSETAFREYIGTDSPSCISPPFSEGLKANFIGPIEVYAKHGLQMLVYKLSLEPEQQYISNDDPVSKQLMLVTMTPLPKEIVGSFSEQIHEAKDIAFVQLTGDRFISKLEDGKIELSQELKRFWVFMPDPDVYEHFNLTQSKATSQFVKDCVKKWQELLSKLQEQFPNADLKLGLFKEPPYFGASFIDWERQKGKIHVSPYVWSIPAPKCPGYDLEWIGKEPSSVYETYVDGLLYLHRSTENELGN